MVYNILISFIKLWLFLETINWINYLLIYINIISPKFKKIKDGDTINIINRIDKF